METKFQTSFIPKTTIAASISPRPRRTTSIFLVLCFFIFLISVLLGGLAFGYLKFVEGQKVSIQANLEKNIRAFEPDTIRLYARLDNRMDVAKTLLEKHIAVSYFLDFLSTETLKSVRFLDMKYALSADGKTADVFLTARPQVTTRWHTSHLFSARAPTSRTPFSPTSTLIRLAMSFSTWRSSSIPDSSITRKKPQISSKKTIRRPHLLKTRWT